MTRVLASIVSALPVMLALSGCLSRPSLEKELFLVSPRPGTNTNATQFEGVFGLEQVTVTPQFQDRPLVYRLAEHTYELDPYAEWLVQPEDMIGTAARAWFRQSNLFRDIAEPESSLRRKLWGELHVTEFYGDFRSAVGPLAVVQVRFILSTPEDGAGRDVLLSKQYARALSIERGTAPALVAGFNQALHEILSEVAADLSGKVQSTNLKLGNPGATRR
jgi:cholesterol transport system auxiliary component